MSAKVFGVEAAPAPAGHAQAAGDGAAAAGGESHPAVAGPTGEGR